MLIPRIYTFNSISFCLGDKFILVKVFDAESMCKIITTHLPKNPKIQPWCFLNCDETSHSLSKVIYYGNWYVYVFWSNFRCMMISRTRNCSKICNKMQMLLPKSWKFNLLYWDFPNYRICVVICDVKWYNRMRFDLFFDLWWSPGLNIG